MFGIGLYIKARKWGLSFFPIQRALKMVQEKINQVKNNIDWKFVTSAVVASAVIGVSVYGLRKAGLGKVATVVKGG